MSENKNNHYILIIDIHVMLRKKVSVLWLKLHRERQCLHTQCTVYFITVTPKCAFVRMISTINRNLFLYTNQIWIIWLATRTRTRTQTRTCCYTYNHCLIGGKKTQLKIGIKNIIQHFAFIHSLKLTMHYERSMSYARVQCTQYKKHKDIGWL